jgi:hypothetical protein
VLFLPNDTISLPLPIVDKKVRGLKSFFFAVTTLFDTRGHPDGSAVSVNYGEKDRFKLVCNAHNCPSTFRPNRRGSGAISEVISASLSFRSLPTLPVIYFCSQRAESIQGVSDGVPFFRHTSVIL